MRYWTLYDEIVYNVKAMSDVKHKVVDRLARKCDVVAKCANATCCYVLMEMLMGLTCMQSKGVVTLDS